MTARDRAALSLLGATATGRVDDAVAALGAVLKVCDVGLDSPGEICWQVNRDLTLLGWLARDAANLARGAITLALPVHEIPLQPIEACQIGARLLAMPEVWSSEIPLVVGEILRARRAA